MRARHLFSPRRLFDSSLCFFTGKFAFVGLGDGGDDVKELEALFEILSVLIALLLSMMYGPFEWWADAVGNIDAHWPTYGTSTFVIVVICIVLLVGSLLMCVVALIVLHGIPTEEEGRYFIKIAGPQLVWPVTGTVWLSIFLCLAPMLDATIRGLGLDERFEREGDEDWSLVASDASAVPRTWQMLVGADGGEANDPADHIFPIALCGFLAVAIFVSIWSVLLVTKQRHTRLLFNADTTDAAAKELDCVDLPYDVEWFAQRPENSCASI